MTTDELRAAIAADCPTVKGFLEQASRIRHEIAEGLK